MLLVFEGANIVNHAKSRGITALIQICVQYTVFLPLHPCHLSHLFPVPDIRFPRPVLQSAPLPPKSHVLTHAILTAQIHPACAPPCLPLSAPADSPCHCESQTLGRQSWAGWSPSGLVFGREGLFRWVLWARRWRDCSERAHVSLSSS